MKCTNEMLQAFKDVFYSNKNGEETLNAITIKALDAALAANHKKELKHVGRYIEPGPRFGGAERVPSIRSYEEYSLKSVVESKGYWVEGEKVYTLK